MNTSSDCFTLLRLFCRTLLSSQLLRIADSPDQRWDRGPPTTPGLPRATLAIQVLDSFLLRNADSLLAGNGCLAKILWKFTVLDLIVLSSPREARAPAGKARTFNKLRRSKHFMIAIFALWVQFSKCFILLQIDLYGWENIPFSTIFGLLWGISNATVTI